MVEDTDYCDIVNRIFMHMMLRHSWDSHLSNGGFEFLKTI